MLVRLGCINLACLVHYGALNQCQLHVGLIAWPARYPFAHLAVHLENKSKRAATSAPVRKMDGAQWLEGLRTDFVQQSNTIRRLLIAAAALLVEFCWRLVSVGVGLGRGC